MAKMSSIQVILGLVATIDLNIEQMNVKTASLYGGVKEDIYMEQPKGFLMKGKDNYVCKLKKCLYF